MSATIIPSLYVKRLGEQTTKLALRLTTARHHCVVRFTGGCGHMDPEDAKGMYELFLTAFNGFAGAMLFGGTRMLRGKEIVPGITEVPPMIKEKNPGCILLGVVPKMQDLRIVEQGIYLSGNWNDIMTIIHPYQDQCLVIQKNPDAGVSWEVEYEECMHITNDLREIANWRSLLVSYNGGSVSEKEILATAAAGWPVLLVEGSGRKTDEYARNKTFLAEYPNVLVAQRDASDLRSKLFLTGALERLSLTMVTGRKEESTLSRAVQ